MGVPSHLVGATVIAILAQRLVRRLCPECSSEVEPSHEEQLMFAPWLEQKVPFRDGEGCRHCLGRGYRGRVGVCEVLLVNRRLQAEISKGSDDRIIASVAEEEGYRPMWWDGLAKAGDGVTSLRGWRGSSRRQ